VGGRAFFSALERATGNELWTSDGTEAGTTLVEDVQPGPQGSFPTQLVDVNGRLFYVAAELTNGEEVWTSDGTAAGTFILKDINPASAAASGSARPWPAPPAHPGRQRLLQPLRGDSRRPGSQRREPTLRRHRTDDGGGLPVAGVRRAQRPMRPSRRCTSHRITGSTSVVMKPVIVDASHGQIEMRASASRSVATDDS